MEINEQITKKKERKKLKKKKREILRSLRLYLSSRIDLNYRETYRRLAIDERWISRGELEGETPYRVTFEIVRESGRGGREEKRAARWKASGSRSWSGARSLERPPARYSAASASNPAIKQRRSRLRRDKYRSFHETRPRQRLMGWWSLCGDKRKVGGMTGDDQGSSWTSIERGSSATVTWTMTSCTYVHFECLDVIIIWIIWINWMIISITCVFYSYPWSEAA